MSTLMDDISVAVHGEAPISRWKDKCIRGHDLTTENTVTRKDGKRACRLCRNAAERIRQKRKRDGLPAISLRINITHCKRGHEFTPINTYFGSTGSRGCKQCRRLVKNHRRKTADKAKSRHESRKDSLKKNYGITIEEYDAMLLDQRGTCAICSSPPTRRRLDVDHCHSTGAIRGLLCEHCNKAIGLLRDDVKRLSVAIAYLSKHQKEDAPFMAT